MTANLLQIPADADAAAEEIIALARDGVTADLLGCLVRRDATALARYGIRQATVALRARSAALLHDALLAKAIADIVHESDPRDVMTSLALHRRRPPARPGPGRGVRHRGFRACPMTGSVICSAGSAPARTSTSTTSLEARPDRRRAGLRARGPPRVPDPARIRSLVREAEQRRHSYLEGRFGAEGAEQIERSNTKMLSKDT